MEERLLYHIWQHRLYNNNKLRSTHNEALEVLTPGQRNDDSGPDFMAAKIKFTDAVLVGNVEIHVNASDWNKHQHQHDAAYNNVVLHVVFNADTEVFTEAGRKLPQLELCETVSTELLNRYQNLRQSLTDIPCATFINLESSLVKNAQLNRAAIERLSQKTEAINRTYVRLNNNWEQSFFVVLARYFGFKVNDQPFEMLATSLDIGVLAKHKQSLFQLEALLFGNAGLLNQAFEDSYPIELQKEYAYLKNKLQLSSLEPHLWKFMRMRPVNFPTVRIAQLAHLVFKSSHLFAKVLEANDIDTLRQLFDCTASAYWQNHYRFDTPADVLTKKMGKKSIDSLIINVVLPFYYLYGSSRLKPQLIEKALSFYEALPCEKNKYIAAFEALDWKPKSALDSQGMLQQYQHYCTQHKCLECTVGASILKKSLA